MKKETIPIIVSGILLILSLIGIGSGVYFYQQYKISEGKLKNPGEVQKSETQALVQKVGKLILLPQEDPQVMIVSDVENLKKNQVFFLDAKDNDALFLFPVAKKAILYRPSTHIIVNVAPILGQDAQASVSGGAPVATISGQPMRIALRNGSGVTGVTKRLEDELNSRLKNIVITEKDNAKRMNYEKTIVVSLSESLNKIVVQQLVNDLSASVSALPSDEPKPAADILIIAGKDRK